VPFQVLGAEEGLAHLSSRYDTPWPVRVRRLHLALWAEALPGCGYGAYDVHFGEAASPGPPPDAAAAGERWIENARLRVEAAEDGTLVVRDKRTGVVYRRCGELEDTGDVGDAFQHRPPGRDLKVTGAQARPVAVRVLSPGPLRATLGIDLELPTPAEATADGAARAEERTALPVSLRVTLDAGAERVRWTAQVENAAKDHRLRVLFPAGSVAVTSVRADSAFAVVERAARAAEAAAGDAVSVAPMQSLVDLGDAECGATVYAEGLPEYEVSGDPARVAVTLLRCVGALSRPAAGATAAPPGPALATPGAQCRGRHQLRLAFEPRAAPPAAAALLRSARAWLHPPRLVPASAGGRWPARLSLLTIESDGGAGAVVSAVKKTDDRDSLLLRVFNPGPAEVQVRVRCALPLARAFAVDFLERTQQEMAVTRGQVAFPLPPGRIQTVELVPDRAGR
jgi:alpha-mannosidase